MKKSKPAKKAKRGRKPKKSDPNLPIDPITHKKEFLHEVGAKLKDGYKNSRFHSYKEFVRECVSLGHKFSPELVVRYFQGAIEPGIYAFTGMARALELSADKTLFSGSYLFTDEKRQKYLKGLSKRIKQAMKDADIRTPTQIAIIAQNLGFKVSARMVEQIIEGQADPEGYELVAILTALRTSADNVLLGKTAPGQANVLLKDTADQLVKLLQSTDSGDEEQQELNILFSKASPAVQEAVLALLRSATKSRK